LRQLTFNGYLKQYVRALSYAGTNGLYALAKEASSINPRLREPLLLYALFWGKEGVLLKATKDARLKSEYATILESYDRSGMEKALLEEDTALPERYVRVYKGYMSVRNKTRTDNHIKLLMRDYILRIQREKGVSTYSVYTTLNINHGNMRAFLNHGDCTKISLDKARSVVAYLEAVT